MAEGGRTRHFCSICLDNFTQPKLLPCAHTFCEECLDTHIQIKACGNKFNCPVCRRETEVPQGGAKIFPTNFYIDESGLEKKHYCRKHKEEIKFYCRECSVALCHSCCVISAHKQHTTVDIADVDQEIRTGHTRKLVRMRTKIQEIKDDLEWSQLKSNDLDTSAATACKNVDSQIDNMCTELKRQGEKKKKEINGKQSAGQEKFEKYKKLGTNLLERVETGADGLSKSLRGQSTKSLIDIYPLIKNICDNSDSDFIDSDNDSDSYDAPVVKYPYFPLTKIDTHVLKQQLGELQIMDGPTFTSSFNLEEIQKKEGVHVYGTYIMISGVHMCIGVQNSSNDTDQPAISMYLYLNIESDNKYSVDFTLKLLHPTDDEKSITRKANHTFQEKKSCEYGWASLLTLQELNGFLNKNQFTIQALVECQITIN